MDFINLCEKRIKIGSCVKLKKISSEDENVIGYIKAKIKIKDKIFYTVEWIANLDSQNDVKDELPITKLPTTIPEKELELVDADIEITTSNPVEIFFSKTRKNAVIPTKRREDAGFDFYACFDEDAIEIKPNHTVTIPTGIATCCDVDYFYLAKERGSTGTKGMALRCGVIDSGYRNEWFVCYTNTTDKTIVIAKENVANNYDNDNFIVYPYAKAIAQGILLPNINIESKEIPYEELKSVSSQRGLGNIGSSNK